MSLPLPQLSLGDWVLIRDQRQRRYLFRLVAGQVFAHHRGALRHEEIMEVGPGGRLGTAQGEVFWIHRPSLEDYVLEMPRQATPTYPKDAATIAFMLDLAPGMRVLEAGSGSGGLALYLARAVGPAGQVISTDLNPRHLHQAQHNLLAYESWDNVLFHLGDVLQYELPPQSLDGIALDLMEPWNLLDHLVPALHPDRSLVTYLPNLTQVVHLLEELRRRNLPLRHHRTIEVTHREWEIRPPVAHPKFQQVGHTAFLTQLRKTATPSGM